MKWAETESLSRWKQIILYITVLAISNLVHTGHFKEFLDNRLILFLVSWEDWLHSQLA